jgi:hypothetical protein
VSAFRVGQRARLIYQNLASILTWGDARGSEGVIAAVPGPYGHACVWLRDGDSVKWEITSFSSLAPLTDPRAEEFVADMERFAHLAKPTVRVLSPDELEKVNGGCA